MTQPPPIAEEFGLRVLPGVEHSVQEPDETQLGSTGMLDRYGLLGVMAGVADDMPGWGTAPSVRDAKLRQFVPTEPYCASSFGAVVTRYAQLSWKLDGPQRTTKATHDMISNCEWGAGWRAFCSSFATDLLTQDKGAFVEIVRLENKPTSPVIHFKTLDPAYCWSTGNPEEPVVYLDRIGGKYHRMKWYQVYHVTEWPVHHPIYHGLQYSALTRALAFARIFRNILTYIDERTGGRHTRQIHIVGGVQQKALDDAMKLQQLNAEEQLLTKFIQPTILTMMDADAKPQVATLEFASLPEGFKLEDTSKWYLTVLALALGTDYGELAPLPGGQLGSGQQSEIMDEKSKEKGAGLFRKIVEDMMNRAILPANVEFSYDEQDLDEEKAEADNTKTRAEGRGFMRQNGEIDDAGARQLALDAGDISPELFAAMNARDLTEEHIRDDERKRVMGELAGAGVAIPKVPATAVNISGIGQTGTTIADTEQSGTKEEERAGPDDERLEAEAEAATYIEKVLGKVYANIRRELRSEA